MRPSSLFGTFRTIELPSFHPILSLLVLGLLGLLLFRGLCLIMLMQGIHCQPRSSSRSTSSSRNSYTLQPIRNIVNINSLRLVVVRLVGIVARFQLQVRTRPWILWANAIFAPTVTGSFLGPLIQRIVETRFQLTTTGTATSGLIGYLFHYHLGLKNETAKHEFRGSRRKNEK